MSQEIKRILVAGLGTMGLGIVHVAAKAGYEVHGYEIKKEFVDRAMKTIEKNLAREVAKGKLSQEESMATRTRIKGFTDLNSAAEGVDFVIEAVFEDIAIKVELYEKLTQLIENHVIIASNTSTLSISLLGGGSGRGDRFIGMHFFNPVPMMKLTEIIRGIDTSDSTVTTTVEVAKRMNKEVIIAKDMPGFIVNRILLPLLNEAVFALQDGVGTVEDIDKGVKLGLGHPMGPLTLLDLIGLDTALHVSTAFYEAFQDSKYRVPPLLRQMVKAGRLGRKSGHGFYKY